MALGTKVGNGREWNHFFIFRAMGAMTAQAIHRQILISRVLVILTNGMGGMGHPLMTGAANLYGGRFLEQKFIVR